MKSSLFITILSVLLVSTLVSAQIVITADDFLTTGSFTRGGTGDSIVSFNVGSAGPNQHWTFGDYGWQDVSRTDYVSPSNTPFAASFPTATHAERGMNDNIEWAWYDYSRVTPEASCKLGEAWAWNDTVIVYDSPECVPLPIFYGYVQTVVSRTHYEIGPDTFENVDSMIATVDGWGTVQSPFIIESVLRIFVHRWSTVRMNGQVADSSEGVNYSWINQHAETVVQVNSEDGVTDPNFNTGKVEMLGVPMSAELRRGRLVQSFSVGQNYPNPFNAITILSYTLDKTEPVELSIFNSLGQRAAMLFSGVQSAGEHSAVWDAVGYPSGQYYARLKAAEQTRSVRMTLVK